MSSSFRPVLLVLSSPVTPAYETGTAGQTTAHSRGTRSEGAGWHFNTPDGTPIRADLELGEMNVVCPQSQSCFHGKITFITKLLSLSTPIPLSCQGKLTQPHVYNGEKEEGRVSAVIRAFARAKRERTPMPLRCLRQEPHVLPPGLEVVGRPVVRRPHGVAHKQPHGLHVVLEHRHAGT